MSYLEVDTDVLDTLWDGEMKLKSWKYSMQIVKIDLA